MNLDLIFEIMTIREGNPRKKTKMSVLIFDFCHIKGGPYGVVGQKIKSTGTGPRSYSTRKPTSMLTTTTSYVQAM